MKKIVRLTELDLVRIVKRVVSEQGDFDFTDEEMPKQKTMSDTFDEVKNEYDTFLDDLMKQGDVDKGRFLKQLDYELTNVYFNHLDANVPGTDKFAEKHKEIIDHFRTRFRNLDINESKLSGIVKKVISEQPKQVKITESDLKEFVGLPLQLFGNKRDLNIIRKFEVRNNNLRVMTQNPPKNVGSKSVMEVYYFICKPNFRTVDIMDANRKLIKTVEVKQNVNMNNFRNEPNYIKIAYAICLPMG